MSFESGEVVTFKGQPEHRFTVKWVSADKGTVGIIAGRGRRWEDVPVDMLERAPVEVKPGQVWRGHDEEEGDYRLFVTTLDSKGDVYYVTTWDRQMHRCKADFVGDFHELELDS